MIAFHVNASEVIQLKLKGDFTKSWENRDKKTRTYHPAVLSFEQKLVEVKMKIRGNHRAGLSRGGSSDGPLLPNCDYPPLKFKFINDFIFLKKGSGVKFVSHCNDFENNLDQMPEYGILGGNNYLLREFYTYKIQNILMDLSYYSSLAMIDFINTGDQSTHQDVNRYGFFLERSKDLGRRLELRYIDDAKNINPDNFSQTDFLKAKIFNWLIGNSDEGIGNPSNDHQFHNYKIYKNKNNKFLPLPYDFNQTRIADLFLNPYLIFWGHGYVCSLIDKKLIQAIFKDFYEKKEDILKLINRSLLSYDDASFFRKFFKVKFDYINEKLLSKDLELKIERRNDLVLQPDGSHAEVPSKYFCSISIK